MEPTTANQHIEATEGICGGKPRIAGHRIRVQDIVIWHEDHGLSPDDIVAQYPTIGLAEVYSALAYYHDHRDEIRKAIDEDHAYAEQFRRDHPDKILPVNGDHGRDA